MPNLKALLPLSCPIIPSKGFNSSVVVNVHSSILHLLVSCSGSNLYLDVM